MERKVAIFLIGVTILLIVGYIDRLENENKK